MEKAPPVLAAFSCPSSVLRAFLSLRDALGESIYLTTPL